MSNSDDKPRDNYPRDERTGIFLYGRARKMDEGCGAVRASAMHEYTSSHGPHVPHRISLGGTLPLPDRDDSSALPFTLLIGRSGLGVSVSGLSQPTTYVWKNTENDEIHFIQEGELDFITAFGTIRARGGDFIFVSRAVGYRLRPVTTSTLRVIVDVPERVCLESELAAGTRDMGRHVIRPDTDTSSRDHGPTDLRMWSFDGVTRINTRGDPLAYTEILAREPPVRGINLSKIRDQATWDSVFPPTQFASTDSGAALLFKLNGSANDKSYHYDNADFDEVVFHSHGSDECSAVGEQSAIEWYPKGTTHRRRSEAVAGSEICWTWLLMSADTLRLTKVAQVIADPIKCKEASNEASK
jgi:homogentisate 1,2-dioxygenase